MLLPFFIISIIHINIDTVKVFRIKKRWDVDEGSYSPDHRDKYSFLPCIFPGMHGLVINAATEVFDL